MSKTLSGRSSRMTPLGRSISIGQVSRFHDMKSQKGARMTTTKISNDVLSIAIQDFGAELHSIQKDNVEYLWQGDPDF